MVTFTFDALFRTTYKGIPDTSTLPSSTTMTHSYYLFSILIQTVILLFFVLYFILSIYRVIKRIKNQNFSEVPEQLRKQQSEGDREESEMKNEQQVQDGNKQKQKQKNLIYKFDQQEDQQEKKKGNDGEDMRQKEDDDRKKEEEESSGENAEDNFNDYHDANQQPFIELDQKLLFFSPFLIGFVVANNLFQADYLVLSSLILMCICFFLINIKGLLSGLRLAPMVFMVFALVPYISFFRGDHDVST